jgi:hypothetical protein
MRSLTFKEANHISGGEDYSVTVVDPVALLYLGAWMCDTDAAGFRRGMVITGMGAGAGMGSALGYAAGYTGLASFGATVVTGFAGMAVGAVAARAAVEGCIGIYNVALA